MKSANAQMIVMLGIGVALFVLSYYFLQGEQFEIYRIFSALIPAIYLACLVVFLRKRAKRGLILFFSLYVISRFISVFYEIDYMASLFLIVNALAFLSLTWYIYRSNSFSKMNYFLKIVFGIVILINAYFIYELIVFVKGGTLSEAHYISMQFNGVCAIIMAFSALLYNHQQGSRASMFYLIAVLLIIFSQVFLTIGYYDIGYGDGVSVYFARILLICSCIMFVRYNDALVPAPVSN
jgi:hypothetical protein